jgi:hypothetical protein
MPRTIIVTLGAVPAMVALAVPEIATLSWSTATEPMLAEPAPWTARSNDSPLALSIARLPEPLRVAELRSWVPMLISTAPLFSPG